MTFLMGLNDTYDTLRTNILSMEPLPPVNKAYSFVQQIESQKLISNVLNTTPNSSAPCSGSANAISTNRNPPQHPWNVWKRDSKKPKTDDRWCDYCNKKGHTKDKCF
ncbi:hypothetical protein RND81_04G067500 [Saponaria officinalis]|uniref:Uncharacterized protein n=1 Tax=Saponaria officinalis TaxID=3572 RepID=A0AAW1LH25_SAPOF